MSVFKRGRVYWYKFRFNGRLYQRTTKSSSKQKAERMEQQAKEQLHQGWSGLEDRKRYKGTLAELLVEHVAEYKVKHKTGTWTTEYGAKHLSEHLGEMFIVSIDVDTVRKYQTIRLQEGASKATVDAEVGVLCRAMSDRGEVLRAKLRKRDVFPLNTNPDLIGKPFSVLEQDKLLKAAAEAKTPLIYFALELALNGAMRDGEIRNLKWEQIDFRANTLTIEKSKNRGSQRVLPLNGVLAPAFFRHREWFIRTFGELRPSWFIFPSGRPGRRDATKPVEGFDAPWRAIKTAAGVEGRWHDCRHTVCSQLAESGASEQTITAIMGHVSPAMLKRYCHVGMEAKREALETMIAWRDRKRELEIIEQQRLADQFAEHTIN